MAEIREEVLMASFYGDEEIAGASLYGVQGQRSAGVSLGDLQMKSTTAPVRSPAGKQLPLREKVLPLSNNVAKSVITKSNKIQ